MNVGALIDEMSRSIAFWMGGDELGVVMEWEVRCSKLR